MLLFQSALSEVAKFNEMEDMRKLGEEYKLSMKCRVFVHLPLFTLSQNTESLLEAIQMNYVDGFGNRAIDFNLNMDF